jgi:cytochrome c biogenesis protein CcmG/thiol:disulfide interchange protein DsbE
VTQPRPKRPDIGRFLSLIFVVMIVGSVVASYFQGGHAMVGASAPSFSSLIVAGDGAGTRVDLASLRGEIVLLDFWATWCPPCRASIPILSRIHTRFRDEHVRVIGVDTEANLDPATLASAHRRLGGSFPSIQDVTGEITAAYDVHNLPTLFLLDRQGVVRYVHVGAADGAALEREIQRLIK